MFLQHIANIFHFPKPLYGYTPASPKPETPQPRPPPNPLENLLRLNATSLGVTILNLEDCGIPSRSIDSYTAPQQQTILAFTEAAEDLYAMLRDQCGLQAVRGIGIIQEPWAYVFTGKRVVHRKRDDQLIDVYLAYKPEYKSWWKFFFIGDLLPFVEWWTDVRNRGLFVHAVQFPEDHEKAPKVFRATTENVADQFRILDLPRELRDQIIRFCLLEGKSISIICAAWPAWLSNLCASPGTPCQ